jgi:serine/threonine protein kinase
MVCDQTLTLIDFNSAHIADELHSTVSYKDEMSGCAGEKIWSAPETYRAQNYSAKCDSYSIGLLIAYMLTPGEMTEEETPLQLWEEVDKSSLDPAILSLVNSLIEDDPLKRLSPRYAL